MWPVEPFCLNQTSLVSIPCRVGTKIGYDERNGYAVIIFKEIWVSDAAA